MRYLYSVLSITKLKELDVREIINVIFEDIWKSTRIQLIVEKYGSGLIDNPVLGYGIANIGSIEVTDKSELPHRDSEMVLQFKVGIDNETHSRKEIQNKLISDLIALGVTNEK